MLVVHGLGPRNSSNQHTFLFQQFLMRIRQVEQFYIVAIGCPGYGKSTGSMTTIKTFPLQIFREILVKL